MDSYFHSSTVFGRFRERKEFFGNHGGALLVHHRAISPPTAEVRVSSSIPPQSFSGKRDAGVERAHTERIDASVPRLLRLEVTGNPVSSKPARAVDVARADNQAFSYVVYPTSKKLFTQSTQKEFREQGGRSRFSTPWASRPLHRDAHLARSYCARRRGDRRSVENQSTL